MAANRLTDQETNADAKKLVALLKSLGISKEELGNDLGYNGEEGVDQALSRLSLKFYKALQLYVDYKLLKIEVGQDVRDQNAAGVRSLASLRMASHTPDEALDEIDVRLDALRLEIHKQFRSVSDQQSRSKGKRPGDSNRGNGSDGDTPDKQ